MPRGEVYRNLGGLGASSDGSRVMAYFLIENRSKFARRNERDPR